MEKLLKYQLNSSCVIMSLILVTTAGLKITAGQRTMSGLTGALTDQTFVLSVMLTGHFGWSHS